MEKTQKNMSSFSWEEKKIKKLFHSRIYTDEKIWMESKLGVLVFYFYRPFQLQFYEKFQNVFKQNFIQKFSTSHTKTIPKCVQNYAKTFS